MRIHLTKSHTGGPWNSDHTDMKPEIHERSGKLILFVMWLAFIWFLAKRVKIIAYLVLSGMMR